MQDITDLTPEDIRAMSYNQLIGVIRETNRPPGGAVSVRVVAQQAFIDSSKWVLEIGTSTGFSAIELAILTHAKVTAVDINTMSLSVARDRANHAGVDKYISFEQQDAHALAYPDEMFDVVFCGNVPCLLQERERAWHEFVRVCKRGGILAAIPMYYIKSPPAYLIREVSRAIAVEIRPEYRDYWMKFYSTPTLEQYWYKDYIFDDVPPNTVQMHMDSLLAQPHLTSLSCVAREALRSAYSNHMQLFRENLTYMGFTILLLRKTLPAIDKELFTAHAV